MKAVKIYNIKWNLSGLDPEEKNEVMKNLPKSKGFKAQDDFNIPDKVPGLLQKKFGYEVEDFSYKEIPIIEDLFELLKKYTPRGYKPGKFFKANGDLSIFAEDCLKELRRDIKWRLRLEEQETPEDEMPKNLDMLMLAWEAITGLDWESISSFDEVMDPIEKIIRDHQQEIVDSRPVRPRRSKPGKGEEEEDEEDDDEEEFINVEDNDEGEGEDD